jgi:hypothetical protein
MAAFLSGERVMVKRISPAIYPALIVLGITSSNCVHMDRGLEERSDEQSTPPLTTGSKLLPAHVAILEETSWLEYVSSNVDAVEYYDRYAFDSEQGPVVGLSLYEDGKRIARLALKNQSDDEVVAILVHEAAHLSGVSQVGRLYSEEMAAAIETKFRLALQESKTPPASVTSPGCAEELDEPGTERESAVTAEDPDAPTAEVESEAPRRRRRMSIIVTFGRQQKRPVNKTN